jgi:hypothetical protein
MLLKMNLLHIYDDVKKYDVHQIGKKNFAALLATTLIEKIDKKTIVL